jgi:hypothetical protein
MRRDEKRRREAPRAVEISSRPSKEEPTMANRLRDVLGVGVLSAAVVLPLAGCQKSTHEEMQEAAEEAGEAAEAVAEEVGEAASDAAEAVEGAVEEAAEAVDEAVEGEDEGDGQ